MVEPAQAKANKNHPGVALVKKYRFIVNKE